MLEITVPERTFYDEKTGTFITVKSQTLQLEHSLVSLSKWESKWVKPFLDNKDKTEEEALDYIRCMTINRNVNPYVYYGLTQSHIKEIYDYINAPMTGTTFTDRRPQASRASKSRITAEVIYWEMITLGIPFECQKWHLNKLLTLIKVCSIKNGPQKKMSKREIMARNAELNAERKAMLHTKG